MTVKARDFCFACVVALCRVSAAAESSESPQSVPQAVDVTDMEAREFLAKSIPETHYSALVVHTSVSIRPLQEKKNSKNEPGDAVDEIHTYRARVLETFRGKALTHIQYEVITEAGEGASVSTTPQILTLCSGPKGLYWPGTGASFPATKDFLAIARRIGKQVAAAKPRDFRQCD